MPGRDPRDRASRFAETAAGTVPGMVLSLWQPAALRPPDQVGTTLCLLLPLLLLQRDMWGTHHGTHQAQIPQVLMSGICARSSHAAQPFCINLSRGFCRGALALPVQPHEALVVPEAAHWPMNEPDVVLNLCPSFCSCKNLCGLG